MAVSESLILRRLARFSQNWFAVVTGSTIGKSDRCPEVLVVEVGKYSSWKGDDFIISMIPIRSADR